MKKTFLLKTLLLLCALVAGMSSAWATDVTTSDFVLPSPQFSENFNSLSTTSATTKINSSEQTAYGIFNKMYNNNTGNTYAIASNATFGSNVLSLSAGSGSPLIASITGQTYGTKGAFSIKMLKTDKSMCGFYAVDDNTAIAHANASVYLQNTTGTLSINSGTGWVNVGAFTSTDIIEVLVIYNNTNSSATYGNSITLGSKKAHVFVNGNCIMNGASPKDFTIPGANLTAFRVLPQATSGNISTIDDVKIYNSLPTAVVTGTHTLTYSATNGSIVGEDGESNAVESGDDVAEGATVTLTATPSSGYTFSNWSVSGTGATLSNTTTNPTTFTMGTADATVTANFEAIVGDYITPAPTSMTIVSNGDIAEFEMSTNISTPSYSLAYYTSSTGDETTTKPSWFGDVEFSGNTLDIEVEANDGAERSAYFKVYSGSTYSPVITVIQNAIVVAVPTFGPAAGAVSAGTTIALTQDLADAIRYTTDGSTPTKTTGTVYSTPIAITTATTIKAIAIKGDAVSDVAEAAYTISVTAPTFNPEGGGASYLQGTGITLTSAGNTIYYNMTTNGSNPDNPTSSSTEYTDPIVLSSGTVKIRAIAYDAYGNASSVASRTYYGKAPATLPFSWAGGVKADLTALTGVVGNGLGSNYAESHGAYRIAFDSDNDYIEIFTDVKPEKVSVGVKMIGGATTSKIKVQESTNGIEFTDVEELTISGSQNDIKSLGTSKAFASTTRVVKLLFVKGANVGVGPISISGIVPVTITAAEYATYVNTTKALDFSETGITVYTATDEETKVTLNEVVSGKVPANTPVVLYKAGADGTPISVPVIASADAIGGTNDLRVSTGTDVANMYVLANKTAGVGFYPWAGTTDLSAGKIYLQGKASYGAREFLGFGNDSETTGIDKVQVSGFKIQDSEVYNLNGQRVMNPTKGLYIVNGRKVVVK